MNDSEVLFVALLVCVTGGLVKEYDKWARKVVLTESEATTLCSE